MVSLVSHHSEDAHLPYCPLCGNTVTTAPFKTWKYTGYKVGRYKCKKCEAKFNLYQGAKSSYTIPKPK